MNEYGYQQYPAGVPQGPVDPLAGFGQQAAPGGPLDGLQSQVGSVLSGAGYRRRRAGQVAEAMAEGAALGFGAWYVARRMRARKQRVGQLTAPVFRSVVMWWLLFVLVALAQGEWRSWAVLGTGVIVDSVISTWYLIHSSRRAARRAGR